MAIFSLPILLSFHALCMADLHGPEKNFDDRKMPSTSYPCSSNPSKAFFMEGMVACDVGRNNFGVFHTDIKNLPAACLHHLKGLIAPDKD